jgi:hypothetical protein
MLTVRRMSPRGANTLGAIPAVLKASGALWARLPGLALDCCRVHYVAVEPLMSADDDSSGSESDVQLAHAEPDHAPKLAE